MRGTSVFCYQNRAQYETLNSKTTEKAKNISCLFSTSLTLLLITKVRCLQKYNFEHTNVFVPKDKVLPDMQFSFDVQLNLKYKTFQAIDLKAFAGQTKKLYLD